MELEERVGLVCAFYGRPHYLCATLHTLQRSNLPKTLDLYLINDGSTDDFAIQIFNQVPANIIPSGNVIKIIHETKIDIWNCLKEGFDYFYDNGYDIMTNLDADAILKKEWFEAVYKLHKRFPDTVVTGFNTLANHPVIEKHKDYNVKMSCGGMNMVFSRNIYPKIIQPTFINKWGWDWSVCSNIIQNNLRIYTTPTSVIQHIGRDSAYGHHGGDIALDFL